MEMLVVLQTHREESASASASRQGNSGDFCLNDVPLTLKIARRRKLEDEAGLVFEELVKYHESSHISSANLMTTMGALTNIAKVRRDVSYTTQQVVYLLTSFNF
jgi:symplekin